MLWESLLRQVYEENFIGHSVQTTPAGRTMITRDKEIVGDGKKKKEKKKTFFWSYILHVFPSYLVGITGLTLTTARQYTCV